MRKPGQFYTGQINIEGTWVNKSFYPSDWTPEEVDDIGNKVFEKSELLGEYGNRYLIYQGVLQNHINIRFIVDKDEDEVKVFYPVFDIVVEKNMQEKKESWFAWVKRQIAGSKKVQANPFTEEMRDGLKQHLYDNFRKVVLHNEMDRSIELIFTLTYKDGEETIDKRYLGPKEAGQIPYFVPGMLQVAHEKSTASVDISDTDKEYIFTVHPDGIITQLTQKTTDL